MGTRSIVFFLTVVGCISLFSCGERATREDSTPGNTFPATRIPLEDTSVYADTTKTDSVPIGSPIPIHR